MPTARSVPEPLQYVSSATRMLDRRRQMIELQQELGKQQAVYAEKDQQLILREQTLKRNDVEFQNHLCRFIRFLQDSDAKRARAEKKERAELNLQARKQAEIDQLLEDIKRLTAQRNDLRLELEGELRYRDYLDSCLLEGDGFHDIAAIMAHHTAILTAKADTAAQHDTCLMTMQREREQLDAYAREKRSQISELQLAVATLQGEAAGEKS